MHFGLSAAGAMQCGCAAPPAEIWCLPAACLTVTDRPFDYMLMAVASPPALPSPRLLLFLLLLPPLPPCCALSGLSIPTPKAPAQCPTPSAHRSTPQRSPQRSEQGSSSSVNSGSSGTSSANVHVCACAGNTQQQLRLLKSQAFTVLSSTNGKRLLRLKQRAATSAPCIVTRQQAPAHPPAFSCHPDVLPPPPLPLARSSSSCRGLWWRRTPGATSSASAAHAGGPSTRCRCGSFC